ncbi:MAG: hypothetical protein JWR08_789, partial [Enterovirga sp.]|nr:hypothetical protein [Enterovirga sp.]
MLSSIPGIENLPTAVRWLIASAIIFILLALFALVLRRLTGGRLTMANERGRARQPRLGIVDVYDLDRQRQLILLRRDNVEHLLLVGGPNDVVVETNIVRGSGTRLPAVGTEIPERVEAPPPEIAPMRPVLDGAPTRPNGPSAEPAVAGAQFGRTETVSAGPARPSASARAGEAAARVGGLFSGLRGTGTARPTPPVRSEPPRSEPPRPEPARPEPARTEPPRPRPSPGPAEPQAAGGARGGALSNMARQLEDAMKRPAESAPAAQGGPVSAAP